MGQRRMDGLLSDPSKERSGVDRRLNAGETEDVSAGVSADVSHRRENLACFLGNVVAAVVDDIPNVLHEDG